MLLKGTMFSTSVFFSTHFSCNRKKLPINYKQLQDNREETSHLVSKNHESVVGLASDGSTHTLSCVTHGVERQEVVLSNLELIPKVLQTSLKRVSEEKRVRLTNRMMAVKKHSDRIHTKKRRLFWYQISRVKLMMYYKIPITIMHIFIFCNLYYCIMFPLY